VSVLAVGLVRAVLWWWGGGGARRRKRSWERRRATRQLFRRGDGGEASRCSQRQSDHTWSHLGHPAAQGRPPSGDDLLVMWFHVQIMWS